jgi:ferric-dicitrate binding protein FerR (iron transport regulator)
MRDSAKREYMARWRNEHKEHRAAYEQARRLRVGITKYAKVGRPAGRGPMRMYGRQVLILGVFVVPCPLKILKGVL